MLKTRIIACIVAIICLVDFVSAQGSNTCAGASATQVSLPFSLNNQSTCGDGNDYTGQNGCVTSTTGNYYGGQDWLYAFTPATDGYITILLNDIQSTGWAYPTLSLFEGCPGTPGACMAWAQGSTWSGGATLLQQVQAGTTYFIQVDAYTWGTYYANCYQFDLSVNFSSITVQPSCTNMNFNSGNLNGWYGTTGRAITGATGAITPTYNATNLGIVTNQQTIMTGGNDPCAGFPRVDPTGGPFSVRLGNNGTGANAEQLLQTFSVNPSNSSFTYRYAVVFEDPGHSSEEQPFFRALLRDQNGEIIPCSDFIVSAAANLPGFFDSPTCTGVRYKPWSTVNVDLTNYLGQNVTVEFTTGDCSQGGHYGYAYIDANCAPSILAELGDTICPGESTTLTAPTGYQSYSWSPGGSTAQSITVSPTTTTTYTLNLTAFNGCTSTFQIPVVVSPIPLASFSYQAPACDLPVLLQNTSTLAFGSVASQTWSIPGGSPTTSTQTDVNVSFPTSGAGTYPITLSITTDQGCSSTVTQNVIVPPCVFRVTITGDTICPGSCYTIPSSTNYGTPPYSYLWSNGSTQSSITVCPTETTIYTLTLTDSNGEIATDTAQVSITPSIVFNSILQNPTCAGFANGSISVQPDGLGPFSFNWSNNSSDSLLLNLSAGNYQLTVEDRFGCPSDTTFQLDQPQALSATTVSVSTTCNLSNGNLEIAAIGGTPIYNYSLNNGTPQSSNTFNNLSTGNYSVIVTDANNCQTSVNASIQAVSSPSGMTVTTDDPSCGVNNGSIAISNITGGISPFTVSLNSAPSQPIQNGTHQFNNLSPSTYLITIEDANGCTLDSTSVLTMIEGPTGMNIQVTPATCGLNNGEIEILQTIGGTPSFNYLLNELPVGAQTNFIGQQAGTYTIEAIDQNGCTIDTSLGLVALPDLTSTAEVLSNVACFGGNDGQASVTIISGSAPFNITWSNAQNGLQANNLSAGTYTVQIVDSVGCVNNHQVVVTSPDQLDFETVLIHPTCNQNNGSIEITQVSGGAEPYSYSINGSSNSATSIFTELADTTYTIRITDNSGCNLSQQVVLIMPNQPSALNTSSTDAFCGNANGNITLNEVIGGVGPYEIAFQNQEFSTLGAFPIEFSNLSEGNYSIVVRDANQCEVALVTPIDQHPAPTSALLQMNPATCDINNASMQVISVVGGEAPYVYSFNNANYSQVNSWNNLAPSQHSIVIKDNNGCMLDTFLTIPALENVEANAFIIHPITCHGFADGRLQAVATAGYQPFQFVWSNGTNGEIVDNLPAGTYSVTVSDSNGCTKVYSVTIQDPEPVQIEVTGPDFVCSGESIDLHAIANGGTGHLEIRWPDYSHAEETITITPTGSGFIDAEARDENGCPASDSQYVQMRLLPGGELTTDIAEGCAPVCVNFSFSQTSGDSIQNYLWSFNNQFTGSNTIEKQCFSTPGSPNVALQIIDINGCTNILHAEGLVEIHPNPVAAFSRTPFDADIVNPEFKFFNESTDAVMFRWGFGDGAVSLQENPTHTYADTGNYTVCLKVTSGFGCVDSTCDDLDVDPFPTIYAPNVFTPNSDGHNEKFKVVVTYATKFRLEIYDRWGELLHVSTDPEEGWDGTYKGNAVQEDVYVWRAYVTNSMNWNKELIGRVTVVE